MNDAHPFDRRIADWLADGPVEAPERVVAEAIDTAYRNVQRRGPLDRVRRALMNTVHPTPVMAPVHSYWGTAAASIIVVLVAGLAIAGGSGLLNRGTGNVPVVVPTLAPSTEAPASSVPSALTSAAPTVQAVLPPSATPVRVTGTFDIRAGYACSPAWCQFASHAVTSDDRLTGPFGIEPAHSTTEATVGTAVFLEPGTEGLGYFRISDMPTDKVAWEGVWVTEGHRQIGLGYGIGMQSDPQEPWPVETIWLQGRNQNAGLTAMVRLSADGTLDGWIFTTPTSH
jgi:hypothetical protein